MHGVLLVDKPEGATSNEVVQTVKRYVRPAKVGHTGTLDPAASGLVVILIGTATRALDYLDESRKEYRLTVLLGEETDTDDREGTVIRTADPSAVTAERIAEVLNRYRGVFDQVPPRFSAVKREGVPLYKLARRGIVTDAPARKVEIFVLNVTSWDPPFLGLEMICSKGTYARALARDVGRELAVGGRLHTLRRIASGTFRVEDALGLDEVDKGGAAIIEARLISLSRALSHIADLTLFPTEVRKLIRGTPVSVPRTRPGVAQEPGEPQNRMFKIVSGDGNLIILVRPEPRGVDVALRPVRAFKAWEDT